MRRGRKDSTSDAPSEKRRRAQLDEAILRGAQRALELVPRLLPREECLPLAQKLVQLEPRQRALFLANSRFAARPEVVRTLCVQSLAAVREDAVRSEQPPRASGSTAERLARRREGSPTPRPTFRLLDVNVG